MGPSMSSWILRCLFLLLSLQLKNTQSGVPTLLRRLVREIYPEIEADNYGSLREGEVCVLGDVVYTAGEVVPAEQPCLRCKCQPPGVHCETIKCTKKSGCKSVHHPNRCCPEYQCECYRENRVYANGERLKTSDGDCKVCYCRGGEIQCTQVSCYVRGDCEGRFVEGQCCPKYDHCPLKESSTSKVTELLKATSEEIKNTTEVELVSEDSTESDVVLETQQPPSILKIGDKLLFLKKGENEGSTPVITIFGAEGLQIGFEESEENENSTQNSLFNNSNDLEPKVAESTHILSLVKHRRKPEETDEEVTKSLDFISSTTEASTLNSTDLPEFEETTTSSFEDRETTTVFKDKEEERMATDSAVGASTDFARSVESIEDTSEESGENTTPRVDYSSSMSSENITIETTESDNYESHDMTHSNNYSTETEIDEITENKTSNSSFVEDVEMIDFNETSTKSSEKRKRESSVEDQADAVFKQLELELNVDSTEKTQSTEDEKKESETIFQELVDETSTPQSVKKNDKNSESVERITDAIGRFVFGGRKGDEGANFLGTLSNLLNLQHRFGKK